MTTAHSIEHHPDIMALLTALYAAVSPWIIGFGGLLVVYGLVALAFSRARR